MLLTVTLNPALDKSFFIERNAPEETLRAHATRDLAGGKGVNVARALRRLGAEVASLMPLGGHAGAFVADLAREEGLGPIVAPIAATTRCALTVQESATGSTWHYLEPGPAVSPGEIARLKEVFLQAIESAELVILSGSVACDALAPVVPWMVEAARERGRETIVDSHGPALSASLAARPWMLKPTPEELEPVIGFSLAEEESQWEALRLLTRAPSKGGYGVPVVALSLGAEGVRCRWEGRCYFVVPPTIELVNALGSGDSLVAGVALARRRGDPPAECLRFGVACGAANAATWDPGGIDAATVAELLPRVIVRELGGE
jgi:tagatose 6-phosphate kinase